jgi:hypothetical protein
MCRSALAGAILAAAVTAMSSAYANAQQFLAVFSGYNVVPPKARVVGGVIAFLCGTATNPGPSGTPTCPSPSGSVTFLRWCVGRAVLDQSPAEGVPLPAKEISRDRVLVDDELVRVIIAARKMGGPYGGIVELLALTAQRREEVTRASSEELDIKERIWTLPKSVRRMANRTLCICPMRRLSF